MRRLACEACRCCSPTPVRCATPKGSSSTRAATKQNLISPSASRLRSNPDTRVSTRSSMKARATPTMESRKWSMNSSVTSNLGQRKLALTTLLPVLAVLGGVPVTADAGPAAPVLDLRFDERGDVSVDLEEALTAPYTSRPLTCR